MNKTKWTQSLFEKKITEAQRANSLDSLANSSNQSESLSDDSHDSDSGADTKIKQTFSVKCEVYSQDACGSRSWTTESTNSERSYEYLSNDKKDCDKRLDTNLETIPEENEPKVSVKAILARFENLKDKNETKDCNNNISSHTGSAVSKSNAKGTGNAARSSASTSSAVSDAGSSGSSSSCAAGHKESCEMQLKASRDASSAVRTRSPPLERLEMITMNSKPNREQEIARSPPPRSEGAQSPNSPTPPSGKYSFMQFAMQNFRQSVDLEMLKMDSPTKSKEKRKEWTWKQQTDLVKWQGNPIDGPLLRLEDPELSSLAIECFECILRYCGDLPLTPEMSEVKCVYTVLMHCHKHAPLRDEVYCQLMKQTTSNKSDHPESCQRAWRLLSIVAAYFACSDHLLPVLTEHLTSAANDRRRICHGTAAVCLANLRKTQRCGGRKNVPSVEEVTAVSAGRSARRQIYRLPGGAERVVNTRCSTVVADVISELCTLIGITNEAEQQEFSLYCIVQGDAFTMPLAADEYILDVTTELHKAAQPFYLIFCRSVWYHTLKHDASPLYTEVLFNQVAPDYLEGLLLRLGNPNLPPSVVRDMALIAALLHRAADLSHPPSIKEVKFLLPKPVLSLREPRPPQWLALVQTSWGQAAGLSVSRAKHRVLQVLSNWSLFGSSFFAVKRVMGENDNWQEHILALNRNGVHFLDMVTHETIHHWPFTEVISTRKVRSEDGALFLDMKCGNLLQQRVTRLQTEQAHEISRLVRQYINLEQENLMRNRHH
nr:unnamed protein product [Callosobruchus analis]